MLCNTGSTLVRSGSTRYQIVITGLTSTLTCASYVPIAPEITKIYAQKAPKEENMPYHYLVVKEYNTK